MAKMWGVYWIDLYFEVEGVKICRVGLKWQKSGVHLELIYFLK